MAGKILQLLYRGGDEVAGAIARSSDDIARAGARGAAAGGDDLARAAGRSTGILNKLVKATGLGAAAAGVSKLFSGKDDEQDSRARGDNVGSNTVSARDVVQDPIIDIPSLVQPLEGELLPAADDVPRKLELTTKEEVPVLAQVDPVTVVENYFNDNYTPVPVEAAIPANVTFTADSAELQNIRNQLGLLSRQNIFLAQRLKIVEDLIEDAILQNQRTLLENERRRDEEDIEKKKVSNEKPFEMVKKVSDSIGAMLSKFVPAAILFGASQAAAAAGEAVGDTTMDEVFDLIDTVEENYVKVTAGLLGAQKAGLGQKVKPAVEMAKNSTIVQKTMQKAADVRAAVTSRAGLVKNTAVEVGQKVMANPVVKKIVGGLNKLVNFMKSLSGIITTPFNAAKAMLGPVLKTLGVVAKGLLTNPIKWYAAGKLLMLTIQAGDAYLLNPSPEAEKAFHTQVKETLNELIDLIGGTWIGGFIGVAAGGALGTITLPVIGTAGGAVVGAIAGILLGSAIFTILPIDVIVNAMYDYFFMDKLNAFDGLLMKMVNHVKNELQKAVDSAAAAIDFVTGGGLGDATEEEIQDDYGDIRGVDLAFEAMDGIGTDENALLYALKDIQTPAQYQAFAEEYERKTGQNFEERLKEELSGSEYRQLQAKLEERLGTPDYATMEVSTEEKLDARNSVNTVNTPSLETTNENQNATTNETNTVNDSITKSSSTTTEETMVQLKSDQKGLTKAQREFVIKKMNGAWSWVEDDTVNVLYQKRISTEALAEKISNKMMSAISGAQELTDADREFILKRAHVAAFQIYRKAQDVSGVYLDENGNVLTNQITVSESTRRFLDAPNAKPQNESIIVPSEKAEPITNESVAVTDNNTTDIVSNYYSTVPSLAQASQVEQKAPLIIPFALPMKQKNTGLPDPHVMTAGITASSEPAKPVLDTSDYFLSSYSFQT